MPKYNHIDNIPAKVFFRILETKDLQQLKPKSREKGLDVVFSSIYDDFFKQSDNDEAKEYLRLHNEILILEYKINVLKQTIAFYYNNKTTKQMRVDFIESLKEGFGIEIDIEKDFVSEIHRVVTVELGYLENDLTFAKSEFQSMTKKSKGKEFNYYDSIVAMGNVLQGNGLLKENMTLATYVACENQAKKAIARMQQTNKKDN